MHLFKDRQLVGPLQVKALEYPQIEVFNNRRRSVEQVEVAPHALNEGVVAFRVVSIVSNNSLSQLLCGLGGFFASLEGLSFPRKTNNFKTVARFV